MPDLSIFLKLGAVELCGAVICSVWLWVLIYRRDLWLRFTTAETAFYQRLRLPSSYITWRRKFAEGKSEIHCIVFLLIISLLGVALAGGAYIDLKHRFERHHQPITAMEPTTRTLDFEKAELQDFLHAYAKFSGDELVESAEVQKLQTSITLHPNHQVTVKEGITLMEDAVKEQAGVVIKHLDDKKMSTTLAKK